MDLEIFEEIKSAAPLQNTVVLKCMFCFSLWKPVFPMFDNRAAGQSNGKTAYKQAKHVF